MQQTTKASSAPRRKITPSERDALRRLAKQNGGLAQLARLLGISRHIIAAAMAGLPLRRGSVMQIQDGLRSHAKRNHSNGSL